MSPDRVQPPRRRLRGGLDQVHAPVLPRFPTWGLCALGTPGFRGRPSAAGVRSLLALLVLGLSLLLTPVAARAASPDPEAEIRAVAAAFRQAILDKDEAGFLALFLDPSTATWVSVESDARLAAAGAAGRPAGDKVLAGPDRTPRSFIRGIVESPGRHDETMEDLRIATDGEIASVHFDFAYLFDGRAITTGEEAWLLVRTTAGWRIVSVVWSKR